MNADTRTNLDEVCREVRIAVLDQAEISGAGHYGSALSIVEILVSLYHGGFLDVRPEEPEWPDRDRFILSKGHGCTALYPILADLGFFEPAHLATFSNLGSILGDHPDIRKVPGADFSSGSLGHGPAVGCGMASALRYQGKDSRVVVLMGDGEMNEGQVWESAAYAAHRGLSNLLVIVDRNRIQVDGTTAEILDFEPVVDKWRAFGWEVDEVDGHSTAELSAAYARFAERASRGDAPPSVIIAETVGARGVSFIEDQAAWHLGYLAEADREAALDEIRHGLTDRRA